MKGIILAGGAGTRLYPLTMVTSKCLSFYEFAKLILRHQGFSKLLTTAQSFIQKELDRLINQYSLNHQL